MIKFVIIIIAICLIFAYIRYIEYKSIFFPMKGIEATPESLGFSSEDIYITTSDNVKINGWFFPVDNPKYTILFCHGNAGNIAHRIEKVYMLCEAGASVFIIDYRGYGNSKGRPSEKGIYLDVQASYDYLVTKRGIKPENIILFGESLGGAAAIDLASKVKIGALITEGTFTSTRDMGRAVYPFLPSFIYSSKMDSLSKIKNVDAPKLLIHSKNDEIVPFELAQELFDAASEPKQFIELMGGHNTAYLDSEDKYKAALKDFINKL